MFFIVLVPNGQKGRCKMKQMSFSGTVPLLFGIVVGLLLRAQASGIDELVEPDSLERIATGFRFTEGPVWHPDGYLLFSDVSGNTIYRWLPDGEVETFRSPSGHSIGLTFDWWGRLIACEYGNRRVSRTEPDGTIATLAGEFDGSRLHSPNDAVVKSDGSIYFTDLYIPGAEEIYDLPSITPELLFNGVYRLSPDAETLQLLESDIDMPNGLAFSPDEKVLYVSDIMGNTVYAFDVQPDGLLANRRVFTHLSGYPDGMKVDMRGNLYVAVMPGIWIYNSEGVHLGDVVTPEPPTNCVFGGADNRTLFITAESSVYRVQMKVQGARPIPDFNGDAVLDIDDLVILIEYWGTDEPLCDIAPPPFGDGTVDILDLELFMSYWEQENVAEDSVTTSDLGL